MKLIKLLHDLNRLILNHDLHLSLYHHFHRNSCSFCITRDSLKIFVSYYATKMLALLCSCPLSGSVFMLRCFLMLICCRFSRLSMKPSMWAQKLQLLWKHRYVSFLISRRSQLFYYAVQSGKVKAILGYFFIRQNKWAELLMSWIPFISPSKRHLNWWKKSVDRWIHLTVSLVY